MQASRNQNGVLVRRDGKGDAIMQTHRIALPRDYYATDIDYVISNSNRTMCIIDNKYSEKYMYSNNTHNVYNTIATMTQTAFLYNISSNNNVYYVNNTKYEYIPNLTLNQVAENLQATLHNTSDKVYAEYTITKKTVIVYGLVIRDIRYRDIAQDIATKITNYYNTVYPHINVSISVYYINNNSIIYNWNNKTQAILSKTDWRKAYIDVGITTTRNCLISAIENNENT